MKTNEISRRSPKNRYFAEIKLINKCYAGGGNTDRIGAETLEMCRKMANAEVERLGKDTRARIEIRENTDIYPKFCWKNVESYEIGE